MNLDLQYTGYTRTSLQEIKLSVAELSRCCSLLYRTGDSCGEGHWTSEVRGWIGHDRNSKLGYFCYCFLQHRVLFFEMLKQKQNKTKQKKEKKKKETKNDKPLRIIKILPIFHAEWKLGQNFHKNVVTNTWESPTCGQFFMWNANLGTFLTKMLNILLKVL